MNPLAHASGSPYLVHGFGVFRDSILLRLQSTKRMLVPFALSTTTTTGGLSFGLSDWHDGGSAIDSSHYQADFKGER
jgi:hypothetical protein